MADFLSGYSIQRWLESCPQGYLVDTEYGHKEGEKEPDLVIDFSDTNIPVFSPTPAAAKAVEDLSDCFELTYITLLRKAPHQTVLSDD